MGSQAALLEAIYAAPERDEPRLVYADWLLERQDPLGELIELQITQARLLRRSAEHQRLQQRVDALWAAGRAAWTPKVKLHDPAHFCAWTFTRGFATGVQTVASAFVEGIEGFFAAAPLLDDVQLDCGRPTPNALSPLAWLERLFSAPAFARVKTLRLGSINDVGAIALSGLEAAGRLRGLGLAHTDLGVATFQVLGSARSQLLNLRSFELLKANGRDVALELLFAHRWPVLESLLIGNEPVGERGIRALTQSGRLAALKHLDLSWSGCGGARSIEALAGCRTLPALETLDLSHCKVDDEMCEALAKAEGFELKVLRLAHPEATARGIAALLKAPFIDGLQLLDLSGSRLDENTQARLVARLGDRVVLSS